MFGNEIVSDVKPTASNSRALSNDDFGRHRIPLTSECWTIVH